MTNRWTPLPISMLAVLAVAGCEVKNPRYCDETTPCEDPRWPSCTLERRQCNPWPDGGPPPGDASTDGRGVADDAPTGDAALDSTGAEDARQDAVTLDGGGDAGSPPDATTDGAGECTQGSDCTAPPACHMAAGATCTNHACAYPNAPAGSTCVGGHCCAGACVPNDAAYCGAACLACAGQTPACDGTACVCNATSCTGGTVCSAGACVAGNCTQAQDCASPPTCRTAAGATCNAIHVCEYPVATDGATCNGTSHCCSGSCVANDASHCGSACGACAGNTPDCNATACVCSAASCPDSLPICDASGACRACASHAECGQRDPGKSVCILQQCKPSVCGDGYVDTAQGEVCDDHNTANGDGCDPTCRYTGTVTTVAGKAGATSQYCDADGSGARFGQPTHVATDGTYIFVADTWENTIRKIALPNYTVTTLAGTPGTSGGVDGTGAAALFNAPKGLATDGQFGNYLFVADAGNHTIRRIRKATGVVDTIAGAAGQSGTANSTTGTSARFNGPSGLAYASQKLYVADTGNCAVRMIDLGTAGFPVYTIAGAPGTCGSTDGAAASARFRQPEALTLKGSSIYVADTANDCIRLIDFAGNVTTPYGTAGQWGSTDATGTSARFQLPGGIDYDPTTNKLFVADTNNNTVRRIDLATNAVTTLAGAAGTAGGDDGTGTAARFQGPHGLVVASGFFANDLLLADGDNSTIRRVAQANAAVATIAGAAPARGSSDGIGAAARFYRPWGIAALGGSLIVTDSGNRTVRQVSSGTWDVVTLAGSAGQANGSVVDGIGSNARFQAPHGAVAVGNLVYVADSYAIREVDPATNYITTRAGSGTQGFQDGDATTARFNAASSIASDGTYLYVGDSCTIRRVTLGAPWTVTTILGQFNSCTSADGQGTTTARVSPAGLATRGSHLYVADAMGALRDVDLSHQPPTIATVAGSLGTLGTTNGFGAQARFGALTAITLDGSSVFVVDNHLTGNLLREIDISTMRVTTLFGQLACVSAIDGDYSRAVIGGSSGLTYLPANGRVYIADATENALREVR